MNTIITGLQWGDEGKGKIVDYLTESADVVIRGQGGNNAGHTVIAGGKKYVLHLLPSGILWDDKVNVIGNGVVLDPVGLVLEIERIEGQGIAITPDKLLISDRSHVVLPFHKELDAAREASLGDQKIGTTKRGIGPAYADKINRCGLRMADLLDKEFATAHRSPTACAEANEVLARYDLTTFDAAQVIDEVYTAFERLRPHITNTIPVLHAAWKSGKNLLFEGAQGTLLDIDFGTYPFVTSSNTTSGGSCTGSGLPPTAIDAVIGVCKAYTTRVGSGPFPTGDEGLSDYLHGLGREFGATTGRPRGCGWLDTVLLRFACMVNGVTGLAVTNVDGLDAYETLQICTGYDIDGETPRTAARRPLGMGSRRAGLRIAARLAERHHRLHPLRGSAGTRESLSHPPRRTLRRADRLCRRGPGQNADAGGRLILKPRMNANQHEWFSRIHARPLIDRHSVIPFCINHLKFAPFAFRHSFHARLPRHSPSHRRHHGRQRPLGQGTRTAAPRRPPRRRGIRPGGHRRLHRTRRRIPHALRLFLGKLEPPQAEVKA
jgi:adenylosuccinate synthase